ncbi:MAG TPA: ABC transporter substrate-binding protein [Steroidobacteraceae bacterium]
MTTFQRRALAAVLSAMVIACGSAAHAQAATPAPAQSQSMAGPSDVVKDAAEGILKELDANRAMYKKEPSKVGALVDKYLLPHFDVETSARAVLGLHWRTATPEQRKRFVDAFYHSLLANYGAALVDFTSDKLKILPTNVEAGAERATVRTEIRRDNGDRVPVNYVMRKTPQGWKAIDVQIEGISYVKSYHDDFGAQIDQQGLDAVISRLEKGEKPGEINKTIKQTS